ncbi:DUF1648 domain-containing protein [Rhodohalobacter sp. SW132]|uniref:DUF1648 domain-containing protein n=1 Tax=Rhodohalobacter sp. SW132 TaxID=2293433 RepID=UPI000E22DFFB|nr:DUF1648 domain-containing protein [Rhodohalobacter sp. SW132]REL33120.1 DUF1648 domain-containing protein [Rhodohalobacter sp. SW132]
MQLFRLTNTTLFISYWVFMIVTYPTLPDQIPMHFGANGEATRFSETSIFSWFLVPIIISIILLPILYLIRNTQTLPIDSPWFNFPFKEHILELEKDQQEKFQSLVSRYTGLLLHTAFFWMIILFLAVAMYNYIYATTEYSIPLFPFLMVHLLLMGVHVGWIVVRFKKRVGLKLTGIDGNSLEG